MIAATQKSPDLSRLQMADVPTSTGTNKSGTKHITNQGTN